MQEEEEGARHLPLRHRGEEEGRAGEADGERDTGHAVRGEGRPDEPPGHRERDAPLHVARHEALAVLDEGAKEPRFRGTQIGHLVKGEAALGTGRYLHDLEAAGQRRDELRGTGGVGGRGEHGLGIVGLDDRHHRGIDPERLRLERHLLQSAQPLDLRNHVTGQEDEPPPTARHLLDGEKARARRRDRDALAEGKAGHHGLRGDFRLRARVGHHEERLDGRGRGAGRTGRHVRAPARVTGPTGSSTPPRRLDSRARCSISAHRAASARLPSVTARPDRAARKRSATL